MSKLSAAISGLSNRMFRKVQGVVWDLMSGQVAVKASNNSLRILDAVELEDGSTAYSIKELLLDVASYQVPAFALATGIEKVQKGDLIIFKDNATFAFVTNNSGASLSVLKMDGTTSIYTPNKVGIASGGIGGDLGQNVLVVQNMLSMFGGNTAQAAGFQNALLPMLMLSKEDGKGAGALDDLLPLMLMQNMQGTATEGSNNQLVQTMMMMKAFGGEGSASGMDEMLPLMVLSGGLGGTPGAANPMQTMLMMKALGGEGSASGMDEMLPLMMLSGGLGGTPGAANPMQNILPFLLLKK